MTTTSTDVKTTIFKGIISFISFMLCWITKIYAGFFDNLSLDLNESNRRIKELDQIVYKTYNPALWSSIPYYEPLIQAQKRGRHLYWTNFKLPSNINERPAIGIGIGINEVDKLSNFHDYDFRKYTGKQPRQKVSRDLVDYEAGKTILQIALNINIDKQKEQQTLF